MRELAETGVKRESDSDHALFGPYEVYERLGVGGMATVHRAKELGIAGFERIVALKRLLPHLAEDESFVRSFVREAKFAAMLNHANIVQLYELGRVGPHYFIAMEYIEGRDVRRVLRQARRIHTLPPLEVALSILIQTCEALHYAHTRRSDSGEPLGLVHRDVSPSNLLVNDAGYVKMIDFGIAKAQTDQLRTRTGRIKGKLAYMAPEAIKGLDLDGRSDLFSAGVVAHELLTARPLFATKNEYETLDRVQNAELVPPSVFNPACPPQLDDIVLKALSRDREQRWQSAEEMRDALSRVASEHRLSVEPRSVSEWLGCAFGDEFTLARGSTSKMPAALAGGTGTATSGSEDPLGVSTPAGYESLEVEWEERSSANPVLLDEVPDVSARAAALSRGNTQRAPRSLWWVTLVLAVMSALFWASLISSQL